MSSVSPRRTSVSVRRVCLREQLAFYQEHQVRPSRLTDAARFSLVLWSQLFNLRAALMIVKPEALWLAFARVQAVLAAEVAVGKTADSGKSSPADGALPGQRHPGTDGPPQGRGSEELLNGLGASGASRKSALLTYVVGRPTRPGLPRASKRHECHSRSVVRREKPSVLLWSFVESHHRVLVPHARSRT